MARIRTIKPGFFRHEGLQELETLHPTSYCMLTFAGLFTVADREGRFEWRPKQIKLDILPFLDFDMSETLNLLETFKFIKKYEVGGKSYGYIPTFLEHQCPNKKEPVSRIPAPCQHSASIMPTRGEVEVEVEVEREEEVNAPSPVFLIAHEHPKLSHMKDDSELPYAVVGKIIEAIDKDGFEMVYEGTKGWAAQLDNTKFADDPYKFFSQFKYRPEAWQRGERQSNIEQLGTLLKADAENGLKLADQRQGNLQNQGAGILGGIPESRSRQV